jgi:hypothetical protein
MTETALPPVVIENAARTGAEPAAMAVLDQRMDFAADEIDAGQTVCPSLKRPTHPRCYGEGYPDWPGSCKHAGIAFRKSDIGHRHVGKACRPISCKP